MEDWRRAIRTPLLSRVVRLLSVIAAILSVGLLAMGAELAGIWGCVTGALGLTGAILLWLEVLGQ